MLNNNNNTIFDSFFSPQMCLPLTAAVDTMFANGRSRRQYTKLKQINKEFGDDHMLTCNVYSSEMKRISVIGDCKEQCLSNKIVTLTSSLLTAGSSCVLLFGSKRAVGLLNTATLSHFLTLNRSCPG